MNDIKRSYVIQWVGPFKSDNDVAKYVKRGLLVKTGAETPPK